jgi:hypothetical protein
MFRRVRNYLALGLLALSGASVGFGQNGFDIVKVEEDWVLIVETPDPLQDAPQVSTWMSPSSSMDGAHFGVELNHAQRPEYEGGGFQTKAMIDAEQTDDRLGHQGENLAFPGETIRWTQSLSIEGGQLAFRIKSGTSQTWGNFGGSATEVKLSTALPNLNQYSPALSADSSGVGFASNRVASLKLAKVRVFTSQGGVSEFNYDREIVPQ